MQIKTKAIVISSLKYQDKSLIVKCFTLSDGIKSYFVRDAFSGKKTIKKIAYFQPLTLLEIEATHRNKGTLEYFKELKIDIPVGSIHTNMTKSAIAMFISEILHHAIHEEEKNEPLFDYLKESIQSLNVLEHISNFHLVMMLEITKFLGFYPDNTDEHNLFFEMKEGVFSVHQAVSSLSEHDTKLLKKLIGLKLDSTDKIFHNSERQTLLKILIAYYGLHLDGFRKPKSLDILTTIFSG